MVLEKTLESPLDCKDIQPVHSKEDQPWDFLGRNDAKTETPLFWPPHTKSWLIGEILWCWEGLGAGGEEDDQGWDGWMASVTRWMWVWVNSGRWWWTGRAGVLQFTGSHRVRHDWATELNWTEMKWHTVSSNRPQGKVKDVAEILVFSKSERRDKIVSIRHPCWVLTYYELYIVEIKLLFKKWSTWVKYSDIFCSVQLLSCVWLFESPWTAAHQTSLSITNSQSLLFSSTLYDFIF